MSSTVCPCLAMVAARRVAGAHRSLGASGSTSRGSICAVTVLASPTPSARRPGHGTAATGLGVQPWGARCQTPTQPSRTALNRASLRLSSVVTWCRSRVMCAGMSRRTLTTTTTTSRLTCGGSAGRTTCFYMGRWPGGRLPMGDHPAHSCCEHEDPRIIRCVICERDILDGATCPFCWIRRTSYDELVSECDRLTTALRACEARWQAMHPRGGRHG